LSLTIYVFTCEKWVCLVNIICPHLFHLTIAFVIIPHTMCLPVIFIYKTKISFSYVFTGDCVQVIKTRWILWFDNKMKTERITACQAKLSRQKAAWIVEGIYMDVWKVFRCNQSKRARKACEMFLFIWIGYVLAF
jgi:hypothetical protein